MDRFANPLVYTPGDNEWTDCHRTNNGSYDPLERLAYDRSVFFDDPGVTLGQHPTKVDTEAAAGFPENVQLRRQGVDFAAVHVVGSNDDLAPWTGLGNTAATPQQVAEEHARMANAVKVVREAFATARQKHDRAVVVLLQADMFDPTYTPTPDDISAFTPLVQALVDESSAFDGDVYLVNGDSHVYNSDRPLAAGSPWLTTYGVQGSNGQPQAHHRRRVGQQHGLAERDGQQAAGRPDPVLGAGPLHGLSPRLTRRARAPESSARHRATPRPCVCCADWTPRAGAHQSYRGSRGFPRAVASSDDEDECEPP